MDKPRKYEAKYKQEAVKLAKEVGAKKASAFFAARRQKLGKSKDYNSSITRRMAAKTKERFLFTARH